MLYIIGGRRGKGIWRGYSSDHYDLVFIRFSRLNGDTGDSQRLSGPWTLSLGEKMEAETFVSEMWPTGLRTV